MARNLRLKDKINIKRKTTIDLGGGSFEETYETIQSNIKAALQPVSLQDITRAGRKINSTAYTCYIDPTVNIEGDDIIEFLTKDFSIVSKDVYPNTYVKLYIEQII